MMPSPRFVPLSTIVDKKCAGVSGTYPGFAGSFMAFTFTSNLANASCVTNEGAICIRCNL